MRFLGKTVFTVSFCFTLMGVPHFGGGDYQDIFINGETVATGYRMCAERYEAIKKVLDKYKRPITVLDIGASQGYFSFRIASDYPSVCGDSFRGSILHPHGGEEESPAL